MKLKSFAKISTTILTGTALTFALFTNSVNADEEKYFLNTNSKVYMNAYDAKAERNSVGSYSAGEYFIYSKFRGYINISKQKNVPGAWIEKKENEIKEVEKPIVKNNKVETKKETQKLELLNGKVKLNKSVDVYINAADALSENRAVTKYAKGEYFIYKTYGDAVNISKVQGRAGGWISIKNVKNAEETPKVEEPKLTQETKVEKIEEPKVTLESKKEENSNKFNLDKKTSVFLSADAAKYKENAVGVYPSGTYYIYKKAYGMLNISREENTPGAWINPNDLGVVEKKVQLRTYEKKELANYSNSTNNSKSVSGEELVSYARQFVGGKYVYRGSTPAGFDCSGLTSYVFRKYGIILPRSSRTQAFVGKEVSSTDLKPGDLLFFGSSSTNISHVGIYAGNGKVVHALNEEAGVVENNLWEYWNGRNFRFAKRVLD